jgi:hypothetical protein
MLQIKRTKLMHNMTSMAAIYNMLQQQPCITSPDIYNIYKQKSATHVQAYTYHKVSYNTHSKWFKLNHTTRIRKRGKLTTMRQPT